MDTLIMLDLMDADESEKTLKVLVEGQLKLQCPTADTLVAACSPGSIEENFLDMTKEVDQRALDALTVNASARSGIVTCGYIAVRNLQFLIPGQDVHELGTLIMVFRNRAKIIRRLAIPDIDENTPRRVIRLLYREIGQAQEVLPPSFADESECARTDTLANAVVAAFRDYALLMTGKNG
jgi:hypothetical protein